MTRVLTGLTSLAAVILLAVTASAQCPNCPPAGGAVGGGGSCLGGNCSPWNRPYTEESSPDVFYNLYQPGNGGQPAGAYPAPFPTPSMVGHQYTTYQPFMPHEMMHMHYRSYHQHYNQGLGLNRTRVHWYSNPIHNEIMAIRKLFSLAR